MQKRLSLADLKAKADKAVLENAEIYMGGAEADCHVKTGGKHKNNSPGTKARPPMVDMRNLDLIL